MSISNYLEGKILDKVLRGTDFTVAAVYVQLHTGDPGEAGTANAAVNTTRQAATFAAASGGTSLTSAQLTWTAVPASETYSYVSLWDAVTGGNCLWSGPMSSGVPVIVGAAFRILMGALSVSLD